MSRTRIAVLFGGRSEEHPASVKSAREVAAHLDAERFEPLYIGITRDGAWLLCDGPAPGWETRASRPVVLSPDSTVHGLLVLDALETIRVDLALPVLHGRFGEDGAIQGLLELAGIPYVGCDIASSALSIDKSLTYTMARSAGVATPEFRILPAGSVADALALDGLDYPVFVKPARSGSSFGVSKVTRAEDLSAAVHTARRYDAKVLIEGAVTGSEVGCAVLGDERGVITGEVDRIALSHGFFRIHQEDAPESGSDNSTPIVPADIPPESRALVRRTSESVYRALGCRGLARVDMFLTPDGRVVLNEVNTMPGMTSYSRYPRMMAAAGLPLGDVLGRLADLALSGAGR